jgi:hypothetical protein
MARPPSSSARAPVDAAVAKRLVRGALGLGMERTEEQKAAEREKRAQHRQQRRRELDVQRTADERPTQATQGKEGAELVNETGEDPPPSDTAFS